MPRPGGKSIFFVDIQTNKCTSIRSRHAATQCCLLKGWLCKKDSNDRSLALRDKPRLGVGIQNISDAGRGLSRRAKLLSLTLFSLSKQHCAATLLEARVAFALNLVTLRHAATLRELGVLISSSYQHCLCVQTHVWADF